MRFDILSRNDEIRPRSPRRRPCGDHKRSAVENRSGGWIALAIAVMTLVAATVLQAPSAKADFTENLREAVMQLHSGSCGPLHSAPLVEKTAGFVARGTDNYLNHDTRVAPGRVNSQGRLVVDPLSILKDLGSNAGKAMAIEGAGETESDAIRSTLIIGYRDIPDCSYAEYGVSALPNNNSGHYYLTALVLAGA